MLHAKYIIFISFHFQSHAKLVSTVQSDSFAKTVSSFNFASIALFVEVVQNWLPTNTARAL